MKKLLSIFVLVAMLLAMVVISTSAAAWDGTTVSASLEGEGTQAKPFLVKSAADLAFLAKSVNEGTNYEGKYFTQTADIDLGNKEWTPIGNASSKVFSGVYNGMGKKIENMKITESGAGIGLFGYVFATADCEAGITNVNLSGSITLTDSADSAGVGGLAGYLYKDSDTVVKETYVLNTTVDVDITISALTKQPRLGGVAGYAFLTTLENVVNNGDINITATSQTRTGGIVGQSNRSTYTSVVNNGNIIETNSAGTTNVGGFIGMLTFKATRATVLTNCVNNGDVTVVNNANAKYSVGGFIGGSYSTANNTNLVVKSCLNTGDISCAAGTSSNFPYVGGIMSVVNYNVNTAIEDCVNTGTITSTGGAGSRAGGIVGVMNKEGESTVYCKNCTSTSNISAYIKNDKTGCIENADAVVAATAAEIVTNALKTSATKINGFNTEYVAPEKPSQPSGTTGSTGTTKPSDTTKPTPTGDASIAVVLVAVVAVCGIAFVSKKVSVR